MFKSIKCVTGALPSYNDYAYSINNSYIYHLIDRDFSCQIKMQAASHGDAAVIKEYKQRDLPVISNLILYYIWYMNEYGPFEDIIKIANCNKIYIDAWYPELQYGQLYHKEIITKLAKLIMVY